MGLIRHSAPCMGEAELAAAARVLGSGQLAQGAEVEAFERECAAFVGRRFAVAVNSGTSALHLALGALGLGPGDGVALPSYACAALATAVRLQGAQVMLGDVGPDFNLDVRTVPPDARAVIVPHLFGARAKLPSSGLVIEDIAQSMGSAPHAPSPVAVTSFYATKLLTTGGEGGMVFSDDEAVAASARDRRDYDDRDDFRLRHNYKMTELQAAIGRAQLARLPEFLARRRAIALEYSRALEGLPLTLPKAEGHVFFRYVVATDERDALEAHLRAQGIEAKRPVYRPAHHFAAALGIADAGHPAGGAATLPTRFPGSERAHRECLSLPLYPSLRDEEATRVIQAVQRFWG